MNDPLEKLLKKMELSCYGKESDLIYRGDALNAIRGACIMAHIPFNSSSPEGRRTMEAIKAVWKVKSASTSLHGGWKTPRPNRHRRTQTLRCIANRWALRLGITAH